MSNISGESRNFILDVNLRDIENAIKNPYEIYPELRELHLGRRIQVTCFYDNLLQMVVCQYEVKAGDHERNLETLDAQMDLIYKKVYSLFESEVRKLSQKKSFEIKHKLFFLLTFVEQVVVY